MLTVTAPRWRELGIAALAAAGLLAACAEGDDEVAVTGQPAPTEATATTIAPGQTTGTTLVPPPSEDRVAVARYAPVENGLLDPSPTGIETVAPTGRAGEVVVTFWSGVDSCYGLARVEVEEADDEVRIGVFTGRREGVDVCIELAQLYSTLVELDEPIDDREVVDLSAE